MKIRCVWEHSKSDSLLHAVDFTGAFTRGSSLDSAICKMDDEIESYCNWTNEDCPDVLEVEIIKDYETPLDVAQADSDVIFDSELLPVTIDEYLKLKSLCLKSAADFLTLYNSIPDKAKTLRPYGSTFYGPVPRTADEMYEHTKNVNAYYFNEIDVFADNSGSIVECRHKGFESLERNSGFLKISPREGSYGEMWSLKKMLRRFIWHDRIHAKSMYRRALLVFGDIVDNPFEFVV